MRAAWDRLLDMTVVGSFGRAGYRARAPSFDPADLDVSLRGRTIAVTGATSGIGLAAARRLSGLGATVVLVGRSPEKLAAAAAAVGGAVHVERADLAELDEVEALAARLRARFPALHALVHNAGLLLDRRERTRAGHERAFATHVLSPFLLTHLLLEPLTHAAPSRVVWVSSGGMYTQHLDLDRCQALDGPYDGVVAYAQQKRAQVLLSELFAERLRKRRITSNAMHPGWVDTPGVASGLPRFRRVMGAVLRTPDEGADTVVWLAASSACADATGQFFLDRRARRTELWSRHGDDERRALWDLCARLTGVGG